MLTSLWICDPGWERLLRPLSVWPPGQVWDGTVLVALAEYLFQKINGEHDPTDPTASLRALDIISHGILLHCAAGLEWKSTSTYMAGACIFEELPGRHHLAVSLKLMTHKASCACRPGLAQDLLAQDPACQKPPPPYPRMASLCVVHSSTSALCIPLHFSFLSAPVSFSNPGGGAGEQWRQWGGQRCESSEVMLPGARGGQGLLEAVLVCMGAARQN